MSKQQQQQKEKEKGRRKKEEVNNDTNAVPRTAIDIVGKYLYVGNARIAKGSANLLRTK